MLGNVWEYCLEPRNPPDFEPVLRGSAWDSPGAEVRAGLRLAPPQEWSLDDPSRPFSVWWFRSGHSQGFRVVRVPEEAGVEERRAYARRIEIAGLTGRERRARVGTSMAHFNRVTGEVRNGGDRTIEELCLKVYSLDPRGKPHLEDVGLPQSRRATYNLCFPALVTSAHPGEHARPSAPASAGASP